MNLQIISGFSGTDHGIPTAGTKPSRRYFNRQLLDCQNPIVKKTLACFTKFCFMCYKIFGSNMDCKCSSSLSSAFDATPYLNALLQASKHE